jgi:hypothetical protein
MLVEIFAGALLALVVARAFGSGPAKAHTIARGLFGRPIPFGAFSELPEINGFPHDHPRYRHGRDGVKTLTPRNFLRMVSINPVCIRKIPVASRKSAKLWRVKAAYFCAL